MKRAIKAVFIILCSIAVALALLIVISSIIYSPEYIYRTIVNGESKITDYRLFAKRIIAKSSILYTYVYNLDNDLGRAEISYHSGDEQKTQSLDALPEHNGTTSCIVIHGDKVIYEGHFNGYGIRLRLRFRRSNLSIR